MHLYDTAKAISDPSHLDGAGLEGDHCAYESSADFFPDGRLAVALLGDIDSEDSPLAQGVLRILNPGSPAVSLTTTSAVGRLGTLATLGNDHLLAMHNHLRLMDARSGIEVLGWPELKSGAQTSSILPSDATVPIIAVDSPGLRFAIADGDGIKIVQCRS